MKIFRKRGEEKQQNISDRLVVIESKISTLNLTAKTLLEVIVENGDEEDFLLLQKLSAEKFAEYILQDINSFGEDTPLHFVNSYINAVFSREMLGKVTFEIDEDNGRIRIRLEDSLVVKVMRDKNDLNSVCKFYEVLFSRLFSSMLGHEINFREVRCALGSGEEYRDVCIFESGNL